MRFIIDKFNNTIQNWTAINVDFSINGHYVIETADGVQIDSSVAGFATSPTIAGGLIEQKYAGLLALNPAFTDIIFDELQDNGDINHLATGHFARTGNFEQFLPPTTGMLTTNVFDLTVMTSFAPNPPVKFMCSFHFYKIDRVATNRASLDEFYTEVSPNLITAEISFDGGATWDAASDGVFDYVFAPDTDLVLRFTNTTSDEVYVGSWAVMLTDVL